MYLTIFFIDVLTYLVFFSFFYFSGRSFLILLTRFTNNSEIPEYTLFQKTKILYPVLGVFIVGNILILLNFLIPLKNGLVLFILIIFLLINFLKIKINLFKLNLVNLISYLLIPSLLVVSLYSTGWHYDAGFYHLNNHT